MISPFDSLPTLARFDWQPPKTLLIAWWSRPFLALVYCTITWLAYPAISQAELYTTHHQPAIVQNTAVDSANQALQNSITSPPPIPSANPQDTLGAKAAMPERMSLIKNDAARPPSPPKQLASPWASHPLSGHTLGGMGSIYGVPPNSNAMIGKNAPRQPVLRVSILGLAKDRKRTMNVAALLQDHQYGNLEKKLGMQVDIVRIITARRTGSKDRIRHRQGFLKAALQLASILPGQQTITKWYQPSLQTGKHAVDVEILLKQPRTKGKKP